MEHRASTRACHLTRFCCSALCLILCEIFPLQLFHSRTSPGVLGSLSLPLFVPLQWPFDYMPIWSPQRVTNPSRSSLSYLLLYQSLPCLSLKLLVADFFLGHQIRKMFLNLLLMNTRNFCSLSQPSSFRTIQERCPHIWPRDPQLGLRCWCCGSPYWSQHRKCMSCLSKVSPWADTSSRW